MLYIAITKARVSKLTN